MEKDEKNHQVFHLRLFWCQQTEVSPRKRKKIHSIHLHLLWRHLNISKMPPNHQKSFKCNMLFFSNQVCEQLYLSGRRFQVWFVTKECQQDWNRGVAGCGSEKETRGRTKDVDALFGSDEGGWDQEWIHQRDCSC